MPTPEFPAARQRGTGPPGHEQGAMMTVCNRKRIGVSVVLLTLTLAVGSSSAQQAAEPAKTASQVQNPTTNIWPELTPQALAWLGAVAVLVLTIRPKPLTTLRNLDGVVLAGMCVMLGLRDALGGPEGSARTWQWWGYLGLAIA